MPPQQPFAVAISFDVEMASNWPYWDSDWTGRKHLIADEVKLYVDKINDLAGEYDAHLHYFVMGAALEQPDIRYLREAAAAGHAIGNHTYSHVNVIAETPDELSPSYTRGDLQIANRSPQQVVEDEISLTHRLIQEQLGVAPTGFRTPGGFRSGIIAKQPELLDFLKALGYPFCSAVYDGVLPEGTDPTTTAPGIFARCIRDLQPFRYPNGLWEVPLMGLTDCVAFRTFRLMLNEWLEAVASGLRTAIEEDLVFSICCHPAILAVVDPHLQTMRLIFETAAATGRAWFCHYGELYEWLDEKD